MFAILYQHYDRRKNGRELPLKEIQCNSIVLIFILLFLFCDRAYYKLR